MKSENTIAAVLAVALGALSSYFMRLIIPLIVLVSVMLVDYGTGMAKAWIKEELSSRIGLRGILKKVGYLVIVSVAGVMDWLIDYGLAEVGVDVKLPFLLAAMVAVWLIINELISILENVAAMGGPVPKFLVRILQRLKSTVSEKAGEPKDDEPEQNEGADDEGLRN